MMLVGGVNIISSTGKFAAQANGYVPDEGVGVVLLKSLKKAIQ